MGKKIDCDDVTPANIEYILRTRKDIRDELWKVVAEDWSDEEVEDLHQVISEIRSKRKEENA